MSKIPITLQLVLLTVALTGFYTMVGQAVPQKEVQPPEVIDIPQDLTSEEMADLGKKIFEGKGLCHTCHTVTGKTGALRYPDLQGVAIRAAHRKPGYSALDYFAETLYQPDAYIVEGFNPGMPTINKPPVGLTDDEILAVIAYLQTLGGTPTVTLATKHAFNGGTFSFEKEGGEGAAPAETAVAAASAAEGSAGGPLASFGCTRCHYTDRAGELKGPSLHDVGARLGRDQLLSALIYHEGDDGLDQVTQDDIRNLVSAMTELKGQG